MKFTKEDEEYLNIENLQNFLNEGGCLAINCWEYLENGDNSNRDSHEIRILAKGDNIEEILERKLYYVFRYRYQYRNSKYIIFNNAIEIVPLELTDEEKEEIKNHNFDRDYIYEEYYYQANYDDYDNNLILNFQEEFKTMFYIKKNWLNDENLNNIKYYKDEPENHEELVYTVCDLLRYHNPNAIRLFKNNFNELKEDCIDSLKALKETYEDNLGELDYSCNDFVKRNCEEYKEIKNEIEEYINEIDYVIKSDLLDEAIRKLMEN